MGGCEADRKQFGYFSIIPESFKGETQVLRAGTLKPDEPLAERDKRQPNSSTLIEIIEYYIYISLYTIG